MIPGSPETPEKDLNLSAEERERLLAKDAKEPDPENKQAAYERDKITLHSYDLFDENEGPGGVTVDEATGQKIDNSTYTGMEDLVVYDSGDENLTVNDSGKEISSEEVGLGEGEHDDAATKFLKANLPSEDDDV